MIEHLEEKYNNRIKFDLRKEFGCVPVIFLIFDDEIGKRISFYADAQDNETLEVFNKLTENKKECNNKVFNILFQNTEWGVELLTDERCVVLIFHDKEGNRGKFRCCNEKMYFNFVDYMDK